MQYFVISLITLMSWAAQANVSVQATGNLVSIPSINLSCYADKIQSRDADIMAPYFKIPKLEVTSHLSNPMKVAMVRVSSVQGYSCEYGGYYLKATGLAEEISPGTTLSTSCPIMCGSLPNLSPGRYPVKIEVFGYQTDPNGNDMPVKVDTETFFSVL